MVLGFACVLAPLSSAGAFEIFGYKFFEPDADPADAVINPIRYSVTLTVAPGPGDVDAVESALRSGSTLISDEEKPVSGSLGLLGKAKTDRKRLVAILYENARYDGLADIYIAGKDIADLAPDAQFDTSKPVPVQIRVRPGPVYQLGNVSIGTQGVPVDPQKYKLVRGGSANSVDLLDSESKLLRDLRDDGRPFVAITKRDIVADAATDRLDYTLQTAPGPRVPFGQTYVAGAKDVDPGFIAYMAGVKAGEVFSPEELKSARERLLKLGVFSSVTVKEAKTQDSDGTLPVQVEVGERKFGFYGIGATYSNTEGAGANGYVGYRNLFGRAESIRLDASISKIGADTISTAARPLDGPDYAASLVFKKPGVLGPDSVYIGSLEAKREQPLAYNRDSYAITSGVEYDVDKNQKVSVGVRGEYETIEDFLGKRDYLLASVPVKYTFDSRDDKLNPTTGILASALVEPTYSVSDSVVFAKARLDAATYYSLTDSNRYIIAGRVAYGNVFGAKLQDVPNDRRFYAGGGGSVRGYEFQSIGPYFPVSVPLGSGLNPDFANTPTGGLSLFEASVEARIGITDTIQIVPFIDAGSVGSDLMPDFSNLKFGAGIGARYITSFGPIRVDVAVPLQKGPRDASYQIYAGIGQAF